MSTVLRKSRPWWQQSGPIVAVGIVAVLLVALSIELDVFAFQYARDQSAYDAAPVCSSPADISNCRFQGTASVTSVWVDKQGYQNVDLTFEQLDGLAVSGALDQGSSSQWQRLQSGDQVEAELWRGQLAVVGGTKTTANPDLFVKNFIPAAYIVTPIALALLAVLVFWGVAYRRAARVRAGQDAAVESAQPATTEQLPLTADMSAYLQHEVRVAANPALVVGLVLAAAAVLPLIFSVAFYLQGRFWQLWNLVSWVLFLGSGGFVSWWILHEIGLEKRDLAAGVFVRATGVFHVAVFSGRAGTRTEVTIGGRTVTGGLPGALEGMESASGSVDYLPICGDLLEVRDDSGRILWSRLSASGAAAPAQSAAR